MMIRQKIIDHHGRVENIKLFDKDPTPLIKEAEEQARQRAAEKEKKASKEEKEDEADEKLDNINETFDLNTSPCHSPIEEHAIEEEEESYLKVDNT